MLLLTFLHKNCMMYIVVRVRGVAQFGRALRSGRRGRRFKSCHPDEKERRENPMDSLFLCAARGKEVVALRPARARRLRGYAIFLQDNRVYDIIYGKVVLREGTGK